MLLSIVQVLAWLTSLLRGGTPHPLVKTLLQEELAWAERHVRKALKIADTHGIRGVYGVTVNRKREGKV